MFDSCRGHLSSRAARPNKGLLLLNFSTAGARRSFTVIFGPLRSSQGQNKGNPERARVKMGCRGYRLRPRLTTRLTFPRFSSTARGLGFSEITWPFLTTFE